MRIIDEIPMHLIADEGMVLTDGETYTTELFLGIYDSPDNWREVPEEEADNKYES